MKFVPEYLRKIAHVYRLRKRFPESVIYPGVSADPKSRLEHHSVVFKNCILFNCSIGAYSYVQENTAIYYGDVGPFCSIARNITVGLFVHPTFMVSSSPVFYDNTQKLPRFFVDENLFQEKMPRTKIEADVWIGEGVKIKAGVSIGVGSVIGAGSVVTKDVPPYTIAAGVPCRPIKRRFEDKICERLEASQWWKMSEMELLNYAKLFSSPEAFLRTLGY